MSLQPGVRYASFWRRLLAYGLDLFLLNIVVGVAIQLFFGDAASTWVQTSLERMQTDQAPLSPPSPFLVPASLLLPAIYTCFFWVRYKALPAQMLLDMQVVDVRSGGAIGVGRAVLRHFTLTLTPYAIVLAEAILPFAGMVLTAVYVIALRRHPRMQAVHDLIAGSVVIMEDESDKPFDEYKREF